MAVRKLCKERHILIASHEKVNRNYEKVSKNYEKVSEMCSHLGHDEFTRIISWHMPIWLTSTIDVNNIYMLRELLLDVDYYYIVLAI